MAMNPMQRKVRNGFLLGFLAALILGGVGIAFLIMQLNGKNKEIDDMRKQAQIAMRQVYVASGNLRKDEGIQAILKSIPAEYVPDKAITDISDYENEDGELTIKALVDIPEGTILTENMVENDEEIETYRENIRK